MVMGMINDERINKSVIRNETFYDKDVTDVDRNKYYPYSKR